jgi:DNA repair exonuclease SbcCD ATPase subunit
MQNLNQAMTDQKQLQALATQLQAAQNQTQQAGQALGQPGQQDLTPAIQQMQQAQQALQQAQAQAGNAPGAQQAMQEAGKNLEASIMSAAQKKQDPAAASNGQAQQAIGQAMSAVSQAMAQAQAQAQAAAPAMAQAGPQPPMPGQMMPGQQMQPNGQIQDGHSSDGIFGGVQGFMANSGPNGANGQVNAGLKPKDRDAIAQLKKEKTPVEYQGMSQQYLKNLAEGSYPAGAAE